MEIYSRIFVASEKTLAGKAVAAQLRREGYFQVISDHEKNLDITSREDVGIFFREFRPEYIFFVGACTGGIAANQKFPADLSSQNLLAACSIFEHAVRVEVKKIFFLASSCIYPKLALQPMKVESLMTGQLEPTSEPYAMSKLMGISLGNAYRSQYQLPIISAIAADVYGPEDSFHAEDSHVVPALMRKIHEAKLQHQTTVTLWGTGTPVRDFLFSEDLAHACIFLMKNHQSSQPVNISASSPVSIKELAEQIKNVVGYKGQFAFDESKSDGTPIKCLEASVLLNLGWQPRWSLDSGLRKTYQEFLQSQSKLMVK